MNNQQKLVVFYLFVMSFNGMAIAQQGNSSNSEAKSAAQAQQIEEVLVFGRAEQAYRVQISKTGKMQTERLALSQSITSLSKTLIADQGARDATDLYRNIAGVSQFTYAGVTARGFRQEEIFYDDLRGNPLVSFSVPQLFNIEQVDFLKGPAGMLYGPGAPGGLFNYITKKPTEDFQAEIRGIVGNWNRRGGSVEVSGPLGLPGLTGRLGGFKEDRDLQPVNAEDQSEIFDIGLKQSFENINILFQATEYDQVLPGGRYRGGLVDKKGEFITDITWNHNEPGDRVSLNSKFYNLRLEGNVSEALSWNASVRRINAVELQNWHSPIVVIERPIPTVSDPDDVHRAYVKQQRNRDVVSWGANAVWSVSVSEFKHRLLAGLDYVSSEVEFFNGGALPELVGGEVPALSISNPQYGVADPSTYNIITRRNDSRQDREGAYFLSELTYGKFVTNLGLRYDQFEDYTVNRGNGNESRFDDSKASARVGLVYRFREDASVYTQWADSFEPQGVGSQSEDAGGSFDPLTGEIFEIGVKTDLLEGRIQASLVAYNIVRKNLLQPDPDAPNDRFVSLGEVESQGIEFDLAMDVTDNWVIVPNYAYNKVEIVEGVEGSDNIANSTGGKFANAPKHQFGLFTRFQIPQLNLALAGGVDHLSDRIGLAGQPVDDYTIFDASIIWKSGPVDFLVRIDNVTNRRYASAGFFNPSGAVSTALGPSAAALGPFDGTLSFPGNARTMFLEISKSW